MALPPQLAKMLGKSAPTPAKGKKPMGKPAAPAGMNMAALVKK